MRFDSSFKVVIKIVYKVLILALFIYAHNYRDWMRRVLNVVIHLDYIVLYYLPRKYILEIFINNAI
jgi:hypothetical protein